MSNSNFVYCDLPQCKKNRPIHFIECRCHTFQKYYDDLFNSENDEQSQITLNAIENFTKLFTNFAKNGYIFKFDQHFDNINWIELLNRLINSSIYVFAVNRQPRTPRYLRSI